MAISFLGFAADLAMVHVLLRPKGMHILNMDRAGDRMLDAISL